LSNETLKKFDYRSCTYKPIAGTEDWIDVAQLDDGCGDYDWTEFKAFYSPSARRYFWHGDGGCSCNGWADDLHTPADFQDGDKAALLRAWEAFAKDNEYSITTAIYTGGVITINNFKEPK
jgi:hypothetical protein